MLTFVLWGIGVYNQGISKSHGNSHDMGRPSSYEPIFAQQAAEACALGATDQDLADLFNVNVRTIHRWKIQHQDFCHALNIQKGHYDDLVERSLAQRAIGYSHPDVDIKVINNKIVITDTIKHYPPDTKACLAWLYNRRPDRWRPQPNSGPSDDLTAVLGKLVEKLPS